MATPFVIKSPKIYSGSYDLSTALKEVSLAYAYDEVDITNFGDACKHGIPGLPSIDVNMAGPYTVDGTSGLDDIFAAQLTVAQPCTISPIGTAGERAYFTKIMPFENPLGGTVGEVLVITATGRGQGYAVIPGKVMATGAKTSSANGTAYELGDVGAGQYLYGCLHVLAASGTDPTLDVIVESDDAEGFSSGATRLTFAQKTAIGSEFITPVAGAITDTWWRAAWTIGGTDNPSFTFAVSVGIF